MGGGALGFKQGSCTGFEFEGPGGSQAPLVMSSSLMLVRDVDQIDSHNRWDAE